ncbi:MAG: hypothetical protein AAGB51_06275 [Planctomycetota bacterium]
MSVTRIYNDEQYPERLIETDDGSGGTRCEADVHYISTDETDATALALLPVLGAPLGAAPLDAVLCRRREKLVDSGPSKIWRITYDTAPQPVRSPGPVFAPQAGQSWTEIGGGGIGTIELLYSVNATAIPADIEPTPEELAVNGIAMGRGIPKDVGIITLQTHLIESVSASLNVAALLDLRREQVVNDAATTLPAIAGTNIELMYTPGRLRFVSFSISNLGSGLRQLTAELLAAPTHAGGWEDTRVKAEPVLREARLYPEARFDRVYDPSGLPS